MNKTTRFIERHQKEFNCCESVIILINEGRPLPGFESNIMKVASPLGGGIGMWGSTCGAAIGAIMALGLIYGTDGNESPKEFQDKKEYLKEVSKMFMRDFEEVFDSVNCNDLLGLDRRTEDFRALYNEKKKAQMRTRGLDKCDDCITWAAKRVLGIISTKAENTI